jgi:hypothetical protein
MTIIPDTKDWTWVLLRPCPECGFDTSSFPREAVSGMIVTSAAAWQDALTGRSDGATFTVETFARYFIHDPVHHFYDVAGIRHPGPPAPGAP